MLTPRPYQLEAEQALWNYFNAGNKGNPLVALPTGTGKSLVISWFIKHIFELYPQSRIIALTHVKELIKQNSEALLDVWPTAPYGVFSSGLNRKEHQWPIIFGGIASVRNAIDILGRFDLMMVDEAHLMNGKDESMYGAVVSKLKVFNPYLKVIGFTATPYRTGTGFLTESGLFTDVVSDWTTLGAFNRLIDEGYMCMLIPKRTDCTFDVSKIPLQNGDFHKRQLEDTLDHRDINYHACQEAIHYGQDRNCWLAFASGIKHAEHISEMLNYLGINSTTVHSKMDDNERDKRISNYRNGKIRCVVTNNVLTTGFNHPPIDLILMMRPTMSPGLWVQMLGRGMRPSPETMKENTLCIAEGQRVLTNSGLVPIQLVTINMKVWDGCSFVSHQGVVFNGIREVITYAGLTATSNHNVWTKKNWQTFGVCKSKQYPISCTGIGRKAISETQGYFTSRNSQRNWKQSIFNYTMYRLWTNIRNRIYKFKTIEGIVSNMRQSCFNPKMVAETMRCSISALYQSKFTRILQLWSSRNTIPFQFSFSNGIMDSRKHWASTSFANRQNQQQWSLRSWQSSVGNIIAEHTQQSKVYDILNCGPFNRFTVEGLLVHNCLDFAGNTPRLGPINDPVIPRKRSKLNGGAVAPIRICDQCGVYNHASATVCYVCGYEFPHRIKIEASAGTDELVRTDIPLVQQFRVDRSLYSKFQSNGINILKVNYVCGIRDFSEIVCLEHPGRAGGMAVMWWKLRMQSNNAPPTVDEALNWTSQLAVPKSIWVDVNKKYPKVVKVEF